MWQLLDKLNHKSQRQEAHIEEFESTSIEVYKLDVITFCILSRILNLITEDHHNHSSMVHLSMISECKYNIIHSLFESILVAQMSLLVQSFPSMKEETTLSFSDLSSTYMGQLNSHSDSVI